MKRAMHDVRLAELGVQPPCWQGPDHVFPMPAPSDGLRSRYRGCLIGGAIGDALGRPVEGRPAHVVRRCYPTGLRDFEPWRGWTSGPIGTFTDGTQLTIVIAEWLIARWTGSNLEDSERLAQHADGLYDVRWPSSRL